MQWIHVLALSVRGCGFTTHNEVVHQAQFFFKDSNRSGIYSSILKDYSPYLQAGSFFPDWGYACGNASEAAEIAHWPIFWNAGVEYINKTYTKPYNSKAKSLIAFLFGTVSHGVADVLWHSLGIDQGLIRVMQHTEFDGSYPSAHTIADIGGEFVLSRLGKLKYLEKYWKFPTDDIINIYASLGFTVSFADFNLCMMQGYVGTQANQALGRYFYPIPARQSRFLTENYFTYFRGGVHSMAVSVNQCWKELINWLERGELTTACLPFKSVSYSRAKTNIQVSPNDSLQNCNEFSRNWVMKLLEKGSTSIRAGPSVLLQGMCMVLRSRVLSQQQSRMELFKNMINRSFQNVISNLREFFHRMADPTVSASNQTTVLYTDMDYAMLGASVANGDFNGDGIKELVVGSPGYSDINFPQCGAIFYFPNGVSKRTAYDNIDGVAKIIVGPKGFSNQFGYSIAAVDLNHDGIDDLAISAPFYGGKDDDFSGAVFVLFGKKGVGLRLDGAWDMIIYGLKDTNNSSATQNFEVFGHILKGIDVNDDGFQDLVVGSPFTSNKAGTQVGKFQVFLSKIGYSSQMTSDDSSWTIYGSQDYEWFGMDFSKIDDQICVGSPGYNTYDIPQSGKVSCFKLPNGNTVRPSLQYEILSSEKFAQFGWSISLLQLGQNSLYMVGSPYEGMNTGHSSLLDFPELYDTDSNSVGKVSFIDSSGNIKSSLKGFSTFGNFGKHCIQLTNDSILISEPGYLTERGRLYQSHIPLISSIPIIKSAQKIWLGDLPKEKFGNAIIVMDLNNDGKKDIIASSVNNFQSEDSWSSGLTGGKLTIIWGR